MLQQFVVYSLVGVINTLVGYSVIVGSTLYLNVGYIAANSIGYGTGLLVSFLLNRRYTFRAARQDVSPARQFGKFVVIFLMGYTVQLSMLIALVTRTGIDQLLAQGFAVLVYQLVTFLGNRQVTFADNGEA